MRRSSLAAPHPSGEALRTVVTACACGVRSPEPPGPTPAPHLGPNERACPRAAVSTSPLGRPRKTQCGSTRGRSVRGRFGARGSVPRLRLGLCPLLLGQPPWRHPGPRGPGGLTASPEKWAWPGSSTAQRRLSRALPRATWRGRLGAVLCLRDTQEANAIPSLAEPGPSATGPPCVHKHAGQSRRAGGAAGAAPPPCRWGQGRGGGKEWLRGWGKDTAVFRDAGWLSGSQGPGPPAPRRAGMPGPPISP